MDEPRRIAAYWQRAIFAFLLVLTPPSGGQAAGGEGASTQLQLYWSRLLPATLPPQSTRGMVLSGIRRSRDEPPILLGTNSGRPSLFIGSDKLGLGHAIALPTKAEGLRIAPGGGDYLW